MNIKFRITFTVLSFAWLTGSILPLLFPEKIFAFPFLQILYSPVCHQNFSKLICSDTACSFLCARCVGIYSGVFLSSLFTLFYGNQSAKHIKYFLVLSLPLFLDVILVSSGIYNYSKIIAYSTGLIFGSAAFYYFYIGISNWLIKDKGTK